jgi:hypothetical protein
MRRFAVALLALWVLPAPVFAEDVFELEVIPRETLASGDTEVELHANGIPGRVRLNDLDDIGPLDRPFHVSVELSHGWSERLEAGIFVQTAPVVRSHGARLAGGHARLKYSFSRMKRQPFDVSLVAEFGINRTAFDENRAVVEVVPILERRLKRATLVANPEWSIPVSGPDAGSSPKFGLAAKIEWEHNSIVSTGAEYYWKTESLHHFDPDADRHHFLMPVIDLKLSSDWEFNVGAGHCLVDRRDRWVVKTIVAYAFRAQPKPADRELSN